MAVCKKRLEDEEKAEEEARKVKEAAEKAKKDLEAAEAEEKRLQRYYNAIKNDRTVPNEVKAQAYDNLLKARRAYRQAKSRVEQAEGQRRHGMRLW